MFENNGFAFDSAGSFFGESTTPSFENGFSNAGPSDGFFSESAFDENGFSASETSVFGESASYCGGFTQFGSAFSESAFDENGFSTDGMFCEGDNSVDSDKKGDYIDKHKGENSMEYSPDFKKALAGRSKEEKRTFDEMKKLQDRKFGTPTTARESISDETFNGVVDKHKEALDRHREGTSMQYGIAKKRGSRFDHKKSIEDNKKK